MRKIHENKFTMYHAVNTFLDENREIVNANQGLSTTSVEFVSKCEEIKQYEEVRRTSTSGRSVAKMRAKRKAITGCMAVTAAIYRLSRKSDDAELEEISNVRKSALELMRDTELIEVLESVYDIAEARLDLLAEYGITAETLGSYQQIVDSYGKAFGRSQSGRFDRIHANTSLPVLFKEGDALLLQMDKFVDGMSDTQTEFVNKYKDRRVIRYYGIRHVKEETLPETTAPVAGSTPAVTTTENNGPPVG